MKRLSWLVLGLLTFLVSGLTIAAEPAVASGTLIQYKYMLYICAVAIAAMIGTFSQSRTAMCALDGIARNPAAGDKIFVPMILALALMESLIIFTFATIFIVK